VNDDILSLGLIKEIQGFFN